MNSNNEPIFDLGRTVMTGRVANRFKEDKEFEVLVYKCLFRHSVGDFGATPIEDRKSNLEELFEGCLKHGGGRILSRFHTNGEPDEKTEFFEDDIYIQTLNESGTVYTCVMYCNEY